MEDSASAGCCGTTSCWPPSGAMCITPPRASAAHKLPSRSARTHSGRCKSWPTWRIAARSTRQPFKGLGLLIGAPRPTGTSPGPPARRGPAWERPGARPAKYRWIHEVSLRLQLGVERSVFGLDQVHASERLADARTLQALAGGDVELR